MRTAIVTDSNSGIFEAEGKQMNVFVIPMPVIIEDESFFEGSGLTHEQFFQCLAEHKRVSTSQPSPADVLDMWDRVLEQGYDELVYIPMSSGLSGSCQAAQAFAQEYDGRVEVVDNRRISVTLRYAVQDAVTLRDRGWTACQIRRALEESTGDSIIYVGVNTLEYLKANGRITPAGAALGTVLNIKPLLVIQGQRLDAYARVRGTVPCQKKLIETMKARFREFTRDGSHVSIGVAGSFAKAADAEKWEAMVRSAFPGQQVHYDPLTFSIACHVGADAFGMGICKTIQ